MFSIALLKHIYVINRLKQTINIYLSIVNQWSHDWEDIQKGKFHVEMTNTTPRGSDTISADDGYVVIDVLTWKDIEYFSNNR